ncbi:MAG TPA: alpha/beta fold hydrolase [Longimicrobiales bacterium]|nr:alpha/beta fold hydrolase [Longimicrobiales bacterium]
MSRSLRLLAPILAALALAAPAAAQDPGGAGTGPRFEDAPCPFDTAGIEAPDLRCGYLLVPESREGGVSRVLRLAVAISTPPNAEPDPVVLLPGGPGGAPLPRYIERFREWVPENRAVVLVDPRGTGYSGGIMCPELGDAYSDIAALDLTLPDARAMRRGAQLACRNLLLREGVDLAAYNSTTVALDLRDLRTALGYDRWNLVSASYGVPFARAAMRLDPEGIRSAVLGFGPSPDLGQLLTGDVPFFQRALQRVFRGCAEDGACAARLPDLEEAFHQAYDSLLAQPLAIRVDPAEFRSETFTVNGQDFVEMIYWLLGSESQVARVPALIHAFRTRDVEVIERTVARSYGGASGLSQGMGISVMCYDAYTPDSRGDWLDAARGYPESLAAIAFFLDPCDFWSPARASAAERNPPASSVPALVVQGEFDPMNPPRVGEAHIRSLPKGQLVIMPGTGHMAGGRSNACWAELVASFIESPIEPVDASCTDELPPLRISPELPGWAQPPETPR